MIPIEQLPSIHGIVVDKNLFKKDLVLVDVWRELIDNLPSNSPILGLEKETVIEYNGKNSLVSLNREEGYLYLYLPQFYSLDINEFIVFEDISIASSMIAGKWDMKKKKWMETGKLLVTEEMMEELRKNKKSEINSMCTQIITSGIDVETSQGKKHFSLTEADQLNLSSLLLQAQASGGSVLYHSDGELCEAWSIEDFMKIATEATIHKTYQTTYANHLKAYVDRFSDITEYETLKNLVYGVSLPEDLQKRMMLLLGGE